MHFGATLRLLRLDAGLTLRALAQRVGVSSAYLSRVENGHDGVPTADRLASIARALDLPPRVLLELGSRFPAAITGYLERVPAAHQLLFEIASRELSGAELARVLDFIDREMPRRPDRAGSGDAPPSVTSLLAEERILCGMDCVEVEDVIDVAAARLAVRGGVGAAELAARLLARERESSTAIGNGVGIPHARDGGCGTRAALITTRRPLDATTPDGVPLRVFFVLLSESGGGRHLEVLARVARLFGEPSVREELLRATSPEQLLRWLRGLELVH